MGIRDHLNGPWRGLLGVLMGLMELVGLVREIFGDEMGGWDGGDDGMIAGWGGCSDGMG